MKILVALLFVSAVSVADMAAGTSNNVNGTAPAKSNVTLPESTLGLSAETSDMEEGKALYENGQLIASLGKFMTVLRKDPHNAEARQYLRMIVDIMRQNPSISAGRMGKQEQAVAANPIVQEEIRKMLQRRSRLTLDLKAIPSVQIDVKGNVNQVSIETPLLFAENSGGLKEQGVPLLDRVSAWLKTYGQQPVIIHCYPEEFQDASTNGSLFLHRYSELFNFFVEEKKLPAQRFVSADLLNGGTGDRTTPGVDVSTASRIVIETIGSQSAMLDSMSTMNSTRALSQWLENSITPNRRSFNPEEGEWVNLDLAAISRMGLRSWTFTIVPAAGAKTPEPVFRLEGKGNVLRRLSWDGHNEKTGDFVSAGSYVAKLLSINADGTIKTQEEVIQVERITKAVTPALTQKKPAKKNKKKVAPKAEADHSPKVSPAAKISTPPPVVSGGAVDAPPAAAGNEDHKDSDSLVDSKPVAEDTEDGVHAIWKQVVQFEPNQSDLMPSVKSSLERIGKTLEVYPLQKVRITGFAMTSEAKAEQLARKRAEAVRAILVNEYHVDAKRVIVAGGKTTADENASKVEMSITN